MMTPKAVETEAPEDPTAAEMPTTLTGTKEPTSLTKSAEAKGEEWTELPERVVSTSKIFADISEGEFEAEETTPPTVQEIHSAIKTLTALQRSAEGVVGEGKPGDVFLCYDLTLRVHGQEAFNVTGVKTMHQILTEEGLPSATIEVESTLFNVLQPVKNRILALVGELTALRRGEVPRPKLLP